MKVLYFHQHFSTPNGSTATRSYEMARALILRGHQVTMICGSYGGGNTGLSTPFAKGIRQGRVDDIDVIEFELRYSNTDGLVRRTLTFLKFAWRSTLLALTSPHDVIFATSTPLTASIPGVAARWLRGSRFVFEVRDLWPELPRAMGVVRNPLVLWILSALEWVSYHSSHRLVGLSPGIVEGIVRRGIAADHVALIPNGCDIALFADKRAPWRPAEVSATDLMAVFAGTHGVANAVNAALDAAAELQRRGRADIKIVLIGDGKLKPALVARAGREQLRNVIFCDSVSKIRLAGLMAETDVGLQLLANVPAFYFGTSPNKFFDYLAAAVPVLNNYPGWVANLIRVNNVGFVVTPDDANAFANALECAADNRATLVQMGVKARELAEREFSREQLSAQWVSWLEQAAEKG